MREFAERFAPRLVGPGPKRQAVNQIVRVMAAVSPDAYRMAMHTLCGFDQRENLAKIDVDCLLIAGDCDTNAPATMMEKMASRINRAEFVQLADTGHMAPIENSAAFNRHMINFLERQPRK